MSYQALARKWRPREFSALVGQDHVVRALTHALETGRLHHAYLFTGTRGVGKTTIARILAKALNCIGPDGQGGVTAAPCNVCPACTAIDAGRFVDYIEMDAASNRGVEEMTQLLERAAYAPTNARYKIYTIDEVHMLTNHAFNAMLKTLEEPPEYVKFILATTDPQKIPVTVLSRCLQFSLKQVPPAAIVERLQHVLGNEGLGATEPAPLRALAHAARGSMRDALSLLDQAIAYAGGVPTADTVRQMLGAIDSSILVQLLDAVADGRTERVLHLADEMAERGLSFSQALRDLAGFLHRIALTQAVGSAAEDEPDAAELDRLAGKLAKEPVQLYYQIALHGRNDLAMAPDEYAGFTMTLLRMMVFAPEVVPAAAGKSAALRASGPLRTAAEARRGDGSGARALPGHSPSPAAPGAGRGAGVDDVPAPPPPSPAAAGEGGGEGAEKRPAGGDGAWPELAASLRLSGLAREMALRSELVSREGDHFHLRVPVKALADGGNVERVRKALSDRLGRAVRLTTETGATNGSTAQARSDQARAAALQEARASIEGDPVVRELRERFGATVDPSSIRPVSG
ncbi:DNA polymerase III subunits gamma and tau [Burkholderiales bacterium GJ-E10]|nr:DNA polymerase III subunits gamma and tau [Burkholderiales bacterium GJ-E10]